MQEMWCGQAHESYGCEWCAALPMDVSSMCPAIVERPACKARAKKEKHDRNCGHRYRRTGDERTQTLPAKLGQKKENMTATAVILSLLLSKSDCGRNCDESLNATPQIRL